jgi:hypothetical protein
MAEDDVQPGLDLGGEEPQPQPEQQPVKQDVVPHAALHEQRELNKQLKTELQASRERSERMEQTFQKLLSQLNEKQETPTPAFDTDPLGHFQAENAKLNCRCWLLQSPIRRANSARPHRTMIKRCAI